MQHEYTPAYCHIIYRQGSRIMTKRCRNEEERLEFMLELLFNNTHPLKEYKNTYYNPESLYTLDDPDVY